MNKIFTTDKFLKIIFGLGLFIILCLGGFGYRHGKNLTETSKLVQHTYEVNMELEKILSRLRYVEASQRGFIVSKDSLFLEPFLTRSDEIIHNLATLRALTSDNPVQQKNLDTLSFNVVNEINLLTETIEIAVAKDINSNAFKSVFKENKAHEDEIGRKIAEMIALENNILRIRQIENEKAVNITPFLLYSILILTLILLLIAYAKINHDINYLKIKNRELEIFKNSSNQAEIISNHGTWTWNVEKNVLEYSDNLYRLLGEEPNSFKPEIDKFLSYVHAEDLLQLEEFIEKMRNEEDLPVVGFRIIDANKKVKHLKTYGKLIVTTDGNKQFIGTTNDVTEDIKNYALIELRNKELEINNKELSTFNYVASHDLQEPLRKIQTFISRLEHKDKDRFSENGKLYIDKIKSLSSRMRLLINDLLQYSRTTNRSNKEFILTNMNMLLENAKEDLSNSAEASNVQITSMDLPDIKVIPFQIQQLFTNLLNNAIKYRRKGIDATINITYNELRSKDIELLKTLPNKYYHHIRFEDNGIGFEQVYAEKIFDLFKRLHNKNEYSGTGIGLAICKKIVENHNGIIMGSGQPNIGANFDIYLPVSK